jgi:hypothetical protein
MFREIFAFGILLFAYDQTAFDGKYVGAFGHMMRSIRVYFGI